MPEADRKPKTYYGIPTDLIEEAAKTHERVLCRIQRRDVRNGRFSSIGTLVLPTVDLGKIDEVLSEKAGGGSYLVRPMRVDNFNALAEPLMQFEFQVEGPPKPATLREHGSTEANAGVGLQPHFHTEPDMSSQPFVPPHMPMQPAQMLPPIPPDVYARLPDFVKGLPLEQMWSYVNRMRPEIADPTLAPAIAQAQAIGASGARFHSTPVAQYTSDQVAMEAAKGVQSQLEKALSKVDELARRLDEERQARLNAEKDAERKVLEAKLDLMMKSQQTPQQKPFDIEGIAKVLAASAPIIAAIVESNASRANALADQQAKAFQIQMQTTQTMLEKASQPPPDSTKSLVEMFKTVGPLLTPVLGDLIKSRGPEAQANLWATLAENQITHVSMVAQLVEQLAKASGNGDTQPWYMPLVQNLLGTALQSFESLAGAQKAAFPGAPAPAQLPAQGSPSMGAPQQQPQPPQQGRPTQGQTIAQLVMGSSGFPQELKTQEWFDIISALHDGFEPDAVADAIVEQLTALEEAGKIPQVLQAEYEKDPRAALAKLINALPVGQQAPDYANAVLDAVVEGLTAEEDAPEGEAAQTDEAQAVDAVPGAPEGTNGVVPFQAGQTSRLQVVPPVRVPVTQ